MKKAIALLAAAISLEAATAVQLLPAGEFSGRDGRPGNGLSWKLPDDKGRALAAKMNALHSSVRFNIDYEHQTLAAEKNGKPAPASGWAQRFEWRDGEGLFAVDMQWTARAKQMIEQGEYRYLSPVLVYNKHTGEVLGVINAALTNVPALNIAPVGEEQAEMLSALFTIERATVPFGALNETELAVCHEIGIDPAEFLQTRDTPRCTCMSVCVCALKNEAGGETLSEEELAVCRATGVTANDFIRTRRQAAAAAAG